MAEVKKLCPECGADVSEGGKRAYKHAVACLHVPDRGAKAALESVSQRQDEYGNRCRILLGWAIEGGA